MDFESFHTSGAFSSYTKVSELNNPSKIVCITYLKKVFDWVSVVALESKCYVI